MTLFGRKKKEEKKDETKLETEAVGEKFVGGQEAEPARTAQMPKGGDDHAYAVISTPHLTEKSSMMAAENKYVFKVAKGTNKIDIKKAIERMYKVKVEKVAVSMKPAKTRRVGRHEGKKAGFKKAIVTLAKGNKIDIIS